MEIDERIKWIVIGVLFFLFMSATFWGLSAKRAVSDGQSRINALTQQITEVTKERDEAKAFLAGDGIPTITGFAQAFFAFNRLSDRYSQAKSFLTENGYKSLFPSGPEGEIPKDTVPISGAVSDVEPYFHRIDERRGTGMLVLKHQLKVNNVASTTLTYVKLSMIRADAKQAYLIDRVEIVQQQKL
ncbi:hypothetical protein ACFQI7_10145 [Paenibacillus allorhizosphaerae]|uniref:Uncharacterized protein n=1 Tax=Paenibacillus allorhizosphaerae TaxID=2849866 RepID=A0ABN7TPV4_9BACL|nr:hypothetical protein [Paenibacillus allorhizosphaerae]CAG7643619.1 hypothetical protein PAECIP111802_03058 [Paenibacillus allorhizosphaerae]